jgi:hypothetical protein
VKRGGAFREGGDRSAGVPRRRPPDEGETEPSEPRARFGVIGLGVRGPGLEFEEEGAGGVRGVFEGIQNRAEPIGHGGLGGGAGFENEAGVHGGCRVDGEDPNPSGGELLSQIPGHEDLRQLASSIGNRARVPLIEA